MHAELNACMRKRLGAMYADVGCMYAEAVGCMCAVELLIELLISYDFL